MNVSSHRSNRRKYIEFLIANNIKHTITYTNRTFKVVSKLGTRVFMSGEISKRGLGFMQTVLAHVKNKVSTLQHLNLDYQKLGLVRMVFNSSLQTGRYSNVIEMDIDKAYWNAAYKLGVLNDEIYNRGLKNKYSKVELLACLGGLAKDKRMREWNGKRYGKAIQVADCSDTKFLWDAISFEIDKCMKNCADELKDNFYYYWTDAIFLKNTESNTSIIESVLHKHGFSCKKIDLEYISVIESDKQVLAFSKENKSHAKDPIRDEQGNYGRIFTMLTVKEESAVVAKIKSLLRQKNIVKNIAQQIRQSA